MHITMPTADLRAARALVEKAVDRPMVIPILGHVLLEADDHLRLTATDTELEVSTKIRLPSIKPGAAALPSDRLKAILGAAPGDEIEIKLNGTGQAHIKSGGASFRVLTLPAGDFPQRKALEGDVKRFDLPAPELRRLLSRTAFAMSDEVTRYYLCGAHLVHKHDSLYAEATNGHLAAQAWAELPEGAMDLDVIVPAKTVGVVLSALKGREDAVSIEASETRIIFGIGDARIDSKLIAATFPDVDRVTPRSNARILTANVAAFAAAVSAAAVVGEKKDRKVVIEISDGAIEVSAAGDGSDARAVIEGAAFSGVPLEIGFNPTYLKLMTDGLTGEDVVLEMEPDCPALVRDPADDRWLGVVMPMRGA